jgi:hypothetical protein
MTDSQNNCPAMRFNVGTLKDSNRFILFKNTPIIRVIKKIMAWDRHVTRKRKVLVGELERNRQFKGWLRLQNNIKVNLRKKNMFFQHIITSNKTNSVALSPQVSYTF